MVLNIYCMHNDNCVHHVRYQHIYVFRKVLFPRNYDGVLRGVFRDFNSVLFRDIVFEVSE